MKNKLRILVYHNVSDVDEHPSTIKVKDFKTHMEFLKENSQVVDLSTIITEIKNKKEPKGDIAISFDDGYKEVYKNALPILEKYNLPATFFIIADFIGNNKFMSWQQLKHLINKGYLIGSHTLGHKRLSTVSEKDLRKEIIESKKILEDNLNKEISLFALPFGKDRDITEKTEQIIRKAGYKCCCTTTGYRGIKKTVKINPYQLKRTPINNMSLRKFKYLLKGVFDPYYLIKEKFNCL